MTPQRQRVFAFIRDQVEATGLAPTLVEIGAHFGFSDVAAWKHVAALVKDGLLRRAKNRTRSLVIVGRIDLSGIETRAMIAELGRRGVQVLRKAA